MRRCLHSAYGLITEVTGARHRQAERFLRTCASAHAERYPRADDSDGTEPSFYARASALLSAACLRGLGDELRSRRPASSPLSPAPPSVGAPRPIPSVRFGPRPTSGPACPKPAAYLHPV
eukprot:CAMPEP_0113283546 /NCGR_PEP_ID=MMETSP0008_2-20120614/29509_1 /TAXON_ID=97485 /ORGANISM="Prymnesium parvum" /LENGTH=119 /DNA_ID=CAMNT_0000134271 /DNA_START=2249 /DNA_END=2608 /DNA_ORIENTATION=+ /assembly_acc=CAM_ASM_000153